MSKSLRILVADDEVELVANLVELLEDMEIRGISPTVDSAKNGEQALECLAQRKYNLAVVDVNMPVFSGIQVIEKVKASDSMNRDIPFVVLTGDIRQVSSMRFEDAEKVHFLEKPIDNEKLMRVASLQMAQDLLSDDV